MRPDKEIQIRKVVMPIARLAKRSLIIFEGPEIRDNTVLTFLKNSHFFKIFSFSNAYCDMVSRYYIIKSSGQFIGTSNFDDQFLSKITQWIVDGRV